MKFLTYFIFPFCLALIISLVVAGSLEGSSSLRGPIYSSEFIEGIISEKIYTNRDGLSNNYYYRERTESVHLVFFVVNFIIINLIYALYWQVMKIKLRNVILNLIKIIIFASVFGFLVAYYFSISVHHGCMIFCSDGLPIGILVIDAIFWAFLISNLHFYRIYIHYFIKMLKEKQRIR